VTRTGSELLADSLHAYGLESFFYLIGGPMVEATEAAVRIGLRGIDVRDERAGTFAAVALSRLRQEPAVVLACSGPGTTNTVTGVSHAFVDGAPVVVIGGSAARHHQDRGGFQATDQVAIMKPITKWAHQVQTVREIPEAVRRALDVARTGSPGPVYLDLPADVLHDVTDIAVELRPPIGALRPPADDSLVRKAIDLLEAADRPVVIAGSGVIWSRAWDALVDFAEASRIPVYTTPMARGVIPEDHPTMFPGARSTAFRESDCLLVVGTRSTYVINWLLPPVMSATSRLIEINIDPAALSTFRSADVAIQADATMALGQLAAELRRRGWEAGHGAWIERLAAVHESARTKLREAAATPSQPMHPLSLCAALDGWLPRDAVLVVDGHEILGFSRRAIVARLPGHTLGPGPYGTMGVGLPFALGAKVARPDVPVVVLTGDGALGYHLLELDTAVRHGLPVVVVVSNNGGWAGGERTDRPGRALGYTPYERLAEALGCWGSKVTEPSQLVAAFDQALDFTLKECRPAVVNVVVSTAQAGGRSFTESRPGQQQSYDPV